MKFGVAAPVAAGVTADPAWMGHLVAKIDSDRAARLAAAGADRVILAMPAVTDITEAQDILSACAERLALKP